MRLGKSNLPGRPLTGLTTDTQRTDLEALNRGLGESEDRLAKIETLFQSLRDSQTPSAVPMDDDMRRYTRSLLASDDLDTRTARPEDRFLSLEGTHGTLRLHTAANFARKHFLIIRINGSEQWDIEVYDTGGTERIYQFEFGTTTETTQIPGDTLWLWNRTVDRWEGI